MFISSEGRLKLPLIHNLFYRKKDKVSKKLRAGLVGCGKQGTTAHLPALESNPDVEIVGVVDINPEHSEPVSTRLGVPKYVRAEDFFVDQHPDYVIVSVPHIAYREIIEAAARHHVHVLKEKPFAMSLEEGIYFRDQARQGSIHLATVVQRRYSTQFARFRDMIDRVGVPFLLEQKYAMAIPDPSSGWRGSRALAGGGCILDMGYHMIDLLTWCFGMPAFVSAQSSTKAVPEKVYDSEDTAAIMFRFDEPELYGTTILTRYMTPRIEYTRLVGSAGQLEIERVGKVEPVSLYLRAPNGDVIEQSILPPDDGAAYNALHMHFCSVIRGEAINETGADDQLRRLAIVEACYRSQAANRQVSPESVLAEYAAKIS